MYMSIFLITFVSIRLFNYTLSIICFSSNFQSLKYIKQSTKTVNTYIIADLPKPIYNGNAFSNFNKLN